MDIMLEVAVRLCLARIRHELACVLLGQVIPGSPSISSTTGSRDFDRLPNLRKPMLFFFLGAESPRETDSWDAADERSDTAD
jgi:hypothetical protein